MRTTYVGPRADRVCNGPVPDITNDILAFVYWCYVLHLWRVPSIRRTRTGADGPSVSAKRTSIYLAGGNIPPHHRSQERRVSELAIGGGFWKSVARNVACGDFGRRCLR